MQRSKPQYLSTFETAEKILELDQVLSVQEVCVQLGVSHATKTAAKVLESYKTHLKLTYGVLRVANMNLGKSVYPCAVVLTACKVTGDKVNQGLFGLCGSISGLSGYLNSSGTANI